MLKNYFKTAFRNLMRNKSYAAINITGLAVGIAAALLIFLVVQYETSFDNFHTKKDHIYRLLSEYRNPDGTSYSEGIPFPVATALRLEYPQLEKVAAIYRRDNVLITIPAGKNEGATKKFREETGVFFTEPQLFDMLDFAWLSGNAAASLARPNTAVLSQAIAEKYFGNWKDAIGKTIQYNNKNLFTVTGVLKNAPANSDFPLTIVASYASLPDVGMADNLNDWVSTWSDACCFVILPKNLSMTQFNKQLAAFTKKHKPAEYAKDNIICQPLKDIHFDTRVETFNHTFGKEIITALVIIGLFLLIIACVNFINLATGQAINRSKEVGVRKVLGGRRSQLVTQFIGETMLITLLAIVVSVGIAALALPFLKQLLSIQLEMRFFSNPVLLLFLLLVAIVVTALSGSYPALVLSRFNPITALKSKVSAKMIGGISLRRGLVVLQFAIAHVLIIGMLIVVSQMNYFRTASLGFDKESIVNVPIPGDSASKSKIDFLRAGLLKNSGIKGVTFCFGSPADNSNWNSDFRFNHAPNKTDFGANLKWSDVEYFKTYNLQFVAGRPYFASDTVREFVVNETLIRRLGITNPQDAIGKEIDFWDGRKKALIAGVIKDFHARSFRSQLTPVILGSWKDMYRTIGIKLKPGNPKATLAYIEKLWNAAYPDYVYEYQFLDTKINNFYQEENRQSQLYKIFAGIAIFISCLGLYGLISFMAVQRTKEVGIRKVLGAGTARIVYLFSKEFTLLITIAFLIASPVAWYFMHQWLQHFVFRIQLGAGIFLAAIAGSMIIAWVAVGYRAIRAAMANPVKSLRAE